MNAKRAITVDALIERAGGPAKLGQMLGVARTTVLDWRRTKTIPGNRVPQISAVFGISADDLLGIVQRPRSYSGAATRSIECEAA